MYYFMHTALLMLFSNLGSKCKNLRPPLSFSNKMRPPSIPDTQEHKTPDKYDIIPSLSKFYIVLLLLSS